MLSAQPTKILQPSFGRKVEQHHLRITVSLTRVAFDPIEIIRRKRMEEIVSAIWTAEPDSQREYGHTMPNG